MAQIGQAILIRLVTAATIMLTLKNSAQLSHAPCNRPTSLVLHLETLALLLRRFPGTYDEQVEQDVPVLKTMAYQVGGLTV